MFETRYLIFAVKISIYRKALRENSNFITSIPKILEV